MKKLRYNDMRKRYFSIKKFCDLKLYEKVVTFDIFCFQNRLFRKKYFCVLLYTIYYLYDFIFSKHFGCE